MFGLGTPELIVIGVIVFLIFGAKRIPEIGKGLGGAIKEFRDARKDLAKDTQSRRKKRSRSLKPLWRASLQRRWSIRCLASNRSWR